MLPTCHNQASICHTYEGNQFENRKEQCDTLESLDSEMNLRLSLYAVQFVLSVFASYHANVLFNKLILRQQAEFGRIRLRNNFARPKPKPKSRATPKVGAAPPLGSPTVVVDSRGNLRSSPMPPDSPGSSPDDAGDPVPKAVPKASYAKATPLRK